MMKARDPFLRMLVLLMIAGCAGSLQAAEFSPALEAELASKSGGELVSAIVILESPVDIPALDDRLHVQRASRAERYRQVMDALQYNARMTQPQFKAELDQAMAAGEVTGYTAYWIENLFVVQATKDFMESLRPRGDVKYGTENFQAVLIEAADEEIPAEHRKPTTRSLDSRTVAAGVVAVGALRVNEELGITGQGVLVGNCDTGVDGTHPALASRWRGNFAPWQECWRDAIGGGTTFPVDNNNHGTHVMGTITGRAISGSDTIWVGCAPNARWIADNAIDQGVSSNFDNDIIDAFQWFANPDGNVNTLEDVPDVVQNSWGVNTNLGYAQCFDYWNTVITNCEALGVVVTWSAGNEGTSGLRSPAIYSLNETQIFSVGAVDATNYSWPYPLASFSSRGPTPCTPAIPDNIKPEVVAPGVDVYSSVPGGGYNGTYDGTSMAGPHVAGVVALMREACPDCDPTTIKTALLNTARDLGTTGQDNLYGWGFIDAYEAVLAVFNLGGVEGVVRDESSNPLAGVLVRNPAGSQQTTTNASGYYFLPIGAGTYTLEYSKYGYVTQNIGGINVVAGDTTTQDATLDAVPTAPLYGYVYDPDNLPLSGAQVRAVGVPIDPVFTNGSGYYSLNLPVGASYTVRADASGFGGEQHDIVFNGTMQQDFHLSSILVEDYESGTMTVFPWHTSGGAPWQIVSTGAYEGTYCARSGAIADNQHSELSLTMNVTTAGPFSFYYRVSSESGYDFLVFLIDGVQQAEWSGEIPWTQASYNVNAGHHTFTWRYIKDGNTASGSDAAWVDYVLFPPSSIPPELPEFACYDFEASAQGWVSGATGDNATTGQWERGDPEGTWNSDRPVQPEDDHTATGVNCWVTGRLAGSSLGSYDIDGGKTTLLSPLWDLQAHASAMIEMWSWYSNDEGGGPDEDYFVVSFSSDGGTNWVDALNTHYDWEYWRRDVFYVEDFVTLSGQVRMRVIGQDQATGSLVEAAVDDVCLYAGTTAPPDPPQELVIIREDDDLHFYWQVSPGATGYLIQRAPEVGGAYDTIATVGAVTEWVCAGCWSALDFASYHVIAVR